MVYVLNDDDIVVSEAWVAIGRLDGEWDIYSNRTGMPMGRVTRNRLLKELSWGDGRSGYWTSVT